MKIVPIGVWEPSGSALRPPAGTKVDEVSHHGDGVGVPLIIGGAHVWGGLSVTASRDGQRATLTLYPPGSTAAERSRERVWYRWRRFGGALWVLVFLLLLVSARPDRAALAATACFAAAWLVVRSATRGRCRARRVSASQHARRAGGGDGDGFRRIVSAGFGLEAADAALERGAITAAQHESFWHGVWTDLERSSPTP